MQIDLSLTRTYLLSLVLLSLSLKVSQASSDSPEFEIINLPNFVVQWGKIATSISAASLAAYFASSFREARFRFSLIPIAATFSAILCYYHLRSYQAGTGEISNILAIGVTLLAFLSFSLNREIDNISLLKSLALALGGFTLISLAIYIFGYGFPITGSGRRFFGLTPHPGRP